MDSAQQGWFSPVRDSRHYYSADYGWQRKLADLTPEQLDRERGPLRPVQPITQGGSAQLRTALRAAGRQAVTTLAGALAEVYRAQREAHGGDRQAGATAAARRSLTAGQEGSWQSRALIALTSFGTGLPPSRVHEPSRQALVDLITDWITNPAGYAELAETLAAEVSAVVDEDGGWACVADDLLGADSPTPKDAAGAYLYLSSLSKDFDPGFGQHRA